jgi:hypothetical protein
MLELHDYPAGGESFHPFEVRKDELLSRLAEGRKAKEAMEKIGNLNAYGQEKEVNKILRDYEAGK